jgi:polar amino acid transport system substrate-binding protein
LPQKRAEGTKNPRFPPSFFLCLLRLFVANPSPLLRFLFVALCALIPAGCAKGPRPLRIGMEMAYPPFEMVDEQGRPAGVSVDLARALGESLHREVVLENMPFDGLIPSLKTAKIDLIISSLTATPERAQSIDFSDPYLTTGLALLVQRDGPLQSVEDLAHAGRKVVVKKGTTGDLYAATVYVLDKEGSCVLEVAQGKADAFIYDQMSTLKNWQRNQEKTRPLLQAFQKEKWAIGVRKGNDALRADVNAFLKQYRERGGFQQLGDRWLAEEKKAFAEKGIPFVF